MSYSAPWPFGFPAAISCLGKTSALDVRAGISSNTWATANLAIYVPVLIPVRVVVVKLALSNGAAVSGNFDIGIYDANGSRLVSTGSTAQSGTTTEQVVEVTDTKIGPGRFYFATCLDNAIGRVVCNGSAAPLQATNGVLTEALGSVTLPATATWAVDQTNVLAPQVLAFLEPTAA